MPKKNNRYLISRIINNNVITSVDKENSEIVLMGKGISFKKKVGDYIENNVVEKVFVLKGNDKNRYLDSIEHISSQYFDIAIEILDSAAEELSISINPIGYIMLADHISYAIERANQKIYLKNELLNEIRHLHPKEFAIGKRALVIIKDKFNIALPIDEAGFIAYHILNQIDSTDNKDTEQKDILINKIIEIIENYFESKLDLESIYYERFLIHLKYFTARVFSDDIAKTNEQKDDFIYRMMRIQYPETVKCVDLVDEFLNYNYQIHVSNEEKGYLIIHINNLLIKSKIVTDQG